MITKGLQSVNLVENSSVMCRVMLLLFEFVALLRVDPSATYPFCCHSACNLTPLAGIGVEDCPRLDWRVSADQFAPSSLL